MQSNIGRKMVDVHILTLPGTRVEWLKECALSLINEPINRYFCDGIEGDIGAARTAAFRCGDSEYVSFVDPDDKVIPGTFAKLVALLEESPDAVMAYSDERLVDKWDRIICDGWSLRPDLFTSYDIRPHNINGEYVHHLRVMRRDAVEKCLPLKTKRMPEPCLMYDLAKLGRFVHLPEVGYMWRIHGENTFFSYTEEEIEECLSYR